MIKIIAVVDNEIGAGGGFDQALNAILQAKRLSVNRFNLEVFTTKYSNLEYLRKLGITAELVRLTWLDRWLARMWNSNFWHNIQSRLKLISSFERKLIRSNCDLVYFVTPNPLAFGLQRTNYIYTLWDLCHRETPEFPEVRKFNEFFIREKHFSHILAPALLTITESERLAEMASRYYGVDISRFLAMPLTPSPFLSDDRSTEKSIVRDKYTLHHDYYLYPAQFWAHKNHVRILQALVHLRDQHSLRPNVVFCGKDHGNLKYIEDVILSNDLGSQVKVLGFVPSEDMRGLYEQAIAIVMPTYFGPTNLPPLEAWWLNVPLIYSSHLSEQVGAAALLVDPDSYQDLANAMRKCTDSEVRERLVLEGAKRLEEISQKRALVEIQLCRAIESFTARRVCWQ